MPRCLPHPARFHPFSTTPHATRPAVFLVLQRRPSRTCRSPPTSANRRGGRRSTTTRSQVLANNQLTCFPAQLLLPRCFPAQLLLATCPPPCCAQCSQWLRLERRRPRVSRHPALIPCFRNCAFETVMQSRATPGAAAARASFGWMCRLMAARRGTTRSCKRCRRSAVSGWHDWGCAWSVWACWEAPQFCSGCGAGTQGMRLDQPSRSASCLHWLLTIVWCTLLSRPGLGVGSW